MRKIKLALSLIVIGLALLSWADKAMTPAIGTEPGNQAPNIETTLLNGEKLTMSHLRGKMILVDFWASFNANDRIENHTKAALLESYGQNIFLKGEGFVIVSISLDRFKTPLITAISNDNLNYSYHVFDARGSESPLAATWNVKENSKYLIDGEGRIVAAGNNLKVIEDALQRLSQNS
ncbi:MAG: TlpA family protein disulfide reductase [Marinilabiliaceae bacterium]|nr:TlpA family protein disulfide reductase [Marinilabiliaceae bacterium]